MRCWTFISAYPFHMVQQDDYLHELVNKLSGCQHAVSKKGRALGIALFVDPLCPKYQLHRCKSDCKELNV